MHSAKREVRSIGYRRILISGLESRRSLGILLLRIFVGARLLYGVVDNVLSWERMIEFSLFLENHGFPFPFLSAVVSVYVQFFGALSLLIGFKTWFFSILLVMNFIVALLFVHIPMNDTIEGMTPALAMLSGSLAIFFTGPDKYSIDHFSSRKVESPF